MIPYIITERKNNTVECNIDFTVVHNNNLIMMSAVDLTGRDKKVFADIILGSSMSIHDREDFFTNIELRSYSYYGEEHGYKYKMSKHNDKMSDGIIYNTVSENYIFDWKNEGLVKTYTNYLRNKNYLSVTEEIVEKVFEIVEKDNVLTLDSLVEECEIFTSNSDMKDVKVWHVKSIELFKELLEKVQLNKNTDT